MHSELCSQLRPAHSECPAGQGHLGSSRSEARTPDQSACTCLSCQHEEPSQSHPSLSQRDMHCPVCLQMVSFPVQTNCGHLFCAPCLITYWRHGSWLDAVSCPLCRQKVSVLCHLFSESRSDVQSKEVLGKITDYNRRYSGEPQRVMDYLCDTPLLLQQLLAHGLGTIRGLVWLFFFRVALCCMGTMVTISSSQNPHETEPLLCRLLGVLDDMIVVTLLLICIINVNQQMTPETHTAPTSQG
ncbi:E3 ubiquitin-protein ligase RNF170-like [Thalassophryne amazonica]|uniref:E3 ubiquitin-protein ligase RNF170-like n=1 Tax=Thalassophryne amazonica TaxID=390379 RepID=UPI001470CFBE|nr:E3 ubiquitin-protein ligase RNF170-like [Thalassophryne amazonica]